VPLQKNERGQAEACPYKPNREEQKNRREDAGLKPGGYRKTFSGDSGEWKERENRNVKMENGHEEGFLDSAGRPLYRNKTVREIRPAPLGMTAMWRSE
jgi:hypothetical protein